MSTEVYSINALSDLTERDRRTISRALRHVAAEGIVPGGHKAWTVETAEAALAIGGRERSDPLIAAMLDRMLNWRAVWGGKRPPGTMADEYTIAELSQLLDVPEGTVLARLRAGMPFAVEGDWTTGAGFKVRALHALEWECLTCAYAAARQLGGALAALGFQADRNRRAAY